MMREDREWRATHCVECYPPPAHCEGCRCHDLVDLTGFICRVHGEWTLVRKDTDAHHELTTARVCAECAVTLAAMADDVGGG